MADQQAATSEIDEGQMTLIDHLTELRNRLGIALAAFLVIFLVSVAPWPGTTSNSIAYHVFVFLQAPLAEILEEKGGGRMILLPCMKGFLLKSRLDFSLPLHYLSNFQYPDLEIYRAGLYKNEKQAFAPFLIATPVLFMAGAAMVYYVVTPMAWGFFVSFEMGGAAGALPIELEPRISEYLSLMMRLIFAFGLAFELPVVLLLLARAGLVTPEGLAEKRKIAIVVAFVAAAILTPPDVISQLLLALPIIMLYELSIFGARMVVPPYENEFDDT